MMLAVCQFKKMIMIYEYDMILKNLIKLHLSLYEYDTIAPMYVLFLADFSAFLF